MGEPLRGAGSDGGTSALELGSLIGERIRIPTPHPATPGAVVDVVVKVLSRLGAPGPVGLTLLALIRGGKVRTTCNMGLA
ncbi:hypothetical protein ACIA8E_12735 [Streptomyces sp. NPDC051664]|uniref:hypothetical protein n=1 Tax=Streptomyces sp. NPDC051664 TaxID=3365668 RepID=UPI003792D6B1